MAVVVDHESDARRTPCPGALMELIRLVRAAAIGDVVAVSARTNGADADIVTWVERSGQTLIAVESLDGGARFVVRRDQ